MTDSLRAFRVRSDDVSSERMEGDVIAVNLHTGAYFSLSGSAADVWTACTSGAPLEACCEALDAAYGASVPRDQVRAMMTACVEQGLLEETAPVLALAPDLPDDLDRSAWVEPRLDVFDDLKDLILVDPIHDASVLGWPRTATLDD